MSSTTIRTICLLLGLAMTAASGAAVAEIYKWTDADGNVHYGDRPAEDVDAERVAIRSNPTDRTRVAAAVQQRREARERLLGQPEPGAAGDEATSAEDQRRVAEERAQKCETYKQRLQTFVQSRRLYREDENGERVYLDEQETQAARDNVEAKVEEYCGS